MMPRLKAPAGFAVLLAMLVCVAWPAAAQQDSAVMFRNVKHAMLVRPTPMVALAGDIGYNNLPAASQATATSPSG